MTVPKLITVAQAAQLKKVTRSAIYAAIRDERLPHRIVLGRFAMSEADVAAWVPAPHAGRRRGTKLSAEAKSRISETQKKRWTRRKQSQSS